MASPKKNLQRIKLKTKIYAVSDIRQKTKLFLNNIKNANNLIDILAQSESDQDDTVLACIHSFHKIFLHLLTNEEMRMDKIPEDDKGLNKEDKFRFWLLSRYNDSCSRLLELLSSENSNIQELALCTLLKFVETEGNHPIRKISKNVPAFPLSLFESIIRNLVGPSTDQADLIGRFQEFLEFDDVRYQCMKTCHRLVKQNQNTSNDVLNSNVLSLLENLSMPGTASSPQDDPDSLSKFLTKPPGEEAKFKARSLKEHKKLFTSLWLDFLKGKISTSIYKRVLTMLHDKVMPHMTSPILLSDFLTQSYNIGGAISLLALNGIFILVNKFNLDYPDFYPKVYALLEPSVFHAKYKARFFYLLDLFLTSTHLPAYMVAAFAKKLARISLVAPPSGLTVTIPFIYNLIMRHPSGKCLLHRPDGPTDLTSDPFDIEERDPLKCKALESSLWELKTLESHYHHSVSTVAKKMSVPLPRQEYMVNKLFETSTADLFAQEKKKKCKEVAVTFEPPKGLFGNREDKMSALWTLR